ncbi:hypothetical protein swp_0645 [Shewanella piezotolerans WP3]|uniref:Uncharacterized protein n=1 Tax=Shewanella piezotolerans (strain WP3 / JCM 13877) TaxID=225849 RepID=B8CII8_SHEPW|nr:hypothetical protein swp_0645 [Shewanella piezotolerans WP3]
MFLPQFIGYFNQTEVMQLSHYPQITYTAVKIARSAALQVCFNAFITALRAFHLAH